MKEEWKPLPNARYLISSLGEVCSTESGKLLKQMDDGRGYLCVSISMDRQPQQKYKVHRLAAEVFLPRIIGANDVNHIDGIKTNNRVTNLEWCTRSENIQHALQLGLMAVGEGHPISELKSLEVEQIKLLFIAGKSNSEIASLYNVARGTISKIRQLKTWRHIRPDLVFEPSCPGGNTKKLSAEDIPRIREAHASGYSL